MALIPLLLFASFLPVSSLTHSSLISCLGHHSVPAVAPSSTSFAPLILPFNLRLNYTPVAVAIPSTAAQVSEAVKCAYKFGTKIAARSGGHSYATYGLGGKNGSLVVDMRKIASVEYDGETERAKVGPGIRLGNLALALWEKGRKRGVPHGLCPGVGLGGHVAHGGFGFTSRQWGTTLDVVTELEAVLANGSIITANKRRNPDLFWAFRGAGSSFGVITSLTLQTFPAPRSGIVFTYAFPSASIATKVSIFGSLQRFSLTAPAELAIRLFHVVEVPEVTLPNSVQVSGVYWGSRSAFEDVISPLVSQWPNATLSAVQELDWISALTSFNNETLSQPENYTQHQTFYAKSLVTPAELTKATLESFFTRLSHPGDESPVFWFVIADLYGGTHSKIISYTENDASYAARDTLFTFQLMSGPKSLPPWSPPYPEDGYRYLDELVKSITDVQTETKFKAYPNYVDPMLSAREAHELYYGSQYERLRKVKESVDPQGYFWNPQAIGVE